jgi:hypothetical protein
VCPSHLAAARLAILTATIACAASTPTPDLVPDASAVALTIDNEHTNDADVYAVRLGSRFRVGFVPAHQTAILRVPVTALDHGDLALLIHLIGTNINYRSDVVHVEAGDQPILELQSSLGLSTFSVVRR